MRKEKKVDELSLRDKMRIVQEIVPGKQITLAHIIANPDEVLYEKLGLDTSVDYKGSAIGIITISPAETAIIAADIAIKSSGAEVGFVDRFSGTLIITGTVSSVEEATESILKYSEETLGYTVCKVTKT
jgi:ethanolamine utilization protein EutS